MSRAPKGFKKGEKVEHALIKRSEKTWIYAFVTGSLAERTFTLKYVSIAFLKSFWLCLLKQTDIKGATSAFTFGCMFIMAEYVCNTLISFEAHGVVTLPHTWQTVRFLKTEGIWTEKRKVKSNYCQICWLLKPSSLNSHLGRQKKNKKNRSYTKTTKIQLWLCQYTAITASTEFNRDESNS